MIEIQTTKFCRSCKQLKALTEEHWYRARPREGHKKEGWQSYCKPCWPIINKINKQKRKVRVVSQ